MRPTEIDAEQITPLPVASFDSVFLSPFRQRIGRYVSNVVCTVQVGVRALLPFHC
jgi:hypothetical protein